MKKARCRRALQFIPAQNAFYYFDDKGYMKTGKMSSVEEENDSFTYYSRLRMVVMVKVSTEKTVDICTGMERDWKLMMITESMKSEAITIL